jgi:single-strand DNA-binding protein
MSSENNITIVGNLTRDPELKFLNSGQASVKLGVAVNRRWQNRQTQEWEERVSFIDVTAFGTLAENVASTMHKGYRVIVVGRIEQRSWETDKGEKRSATEISAGNIGIDLTYKVADVRDGAGNASKAAVRATAFEEAF